jgi:hypothetical protein
MSRAPFAKAHDVPNPVAALVSCQLDGLACNLQKGKKTYKPGPRNSVEHASKQINLLLFYSFEE